MTDETTKPDELLTGRDKMVAVGKANLDAHRAATQFNGERANTPNMAEGGANTKPWSIRGSQKYFAAVSLDLDEVLDKTENDIIKQLMPEKKKTTLAQVGAARQLVRFAKECADAGTVTENIDGKLVQTNLNADFAALGNKSVEELREYRKQLESRRAELESAGSGEATGGGNAARDPAAGGDAPT